MSEVEHLKKDGKAEFGSTKYKFLSEAKTTQIFREKLIEYKLVLFPIKVEETKVEKVTRGIYTYRLLNTEKPEEFIDLMSSGQGHDGTDKGSGKASSYAYKYLLWRTFAVPSNDDPDQVTSAEHLFNPEQDKKDWADAETKLYAAYAKMGFKEVDEVENKYLERTGKTVIKSTTKEMLTEVTKINKRLKKEGTQ
jgi:hypothetical protein